MSLQDGGSVSEMRPSALLGADPSRRGSVLSVVLSIGGGIARYFTSLDVGR